MKLEYKLKYIEKKEDASKIVTSYIFEARDKAYTGVSKWKVGGENSAQIMENLNLPTKIGDIIVMDLAPKNVQSSLTAKKGKAAV